MFCLFVRLCTIYVRVKFDELSALIMIDVENIYARDLQVWHPPHDLETLNTKRSQGFRNEKYNETELLVYTVKYTTWNRTKRTLRPITIWLETSGDVTYISWIKQNNVLLFLRTKHSLHDAAILCKSDQNVWVLLLKIKFPWAFIYTISSVFSYSPEPCLSSAKAQIPGLVDHGGVQPLGWGRELST